MSAEQEGDTVGRASGTSLDSSEDHGPLEQSLNSANASISLEPRSCQDGEEQALESHEVIELQTFSERKAWIEEKIKFLESMPPIDVFVGMDSIKVSRTGVPGLPTRAELQGWIVEHDRIEKETEIFDSGELKKLKKFTKAATQRNLSPEDTDLIELTLTTIYQLDKLLHLLRDRSENLELLSLRMTWEEQRIGVWTDRQGIISDLQTFLATRARWTPVVYDIEPKPEDSRGRRGSVASLASMASMASDSSASSPAYSRSARFKLVEVLSRDAAQFSARIASLRHGKIFSAGKALDKLIDNSRKPVPDEFLDEQDTLEEQGINELEDIGKFITNVVMQWRKADEIYVETMKDQIAAQNLFEEIETAKLHHPTSRQCTSFMSRIDAVLKRLTLRGNPASTNSTFPRPSHSLFPDQQSSNDAIAGLLSSDIKAATKLAQSVEALAKEYRESYEAVRRAEVLMQAAHDLCDQLSVLTHRLEFGLTVDDGDGTPPDLTSVLCLEAPRHSTYLALLPSTIEELDKVQNSAIELLQQSQVASLALERPGIDPTFRSDTASVLRKLRGLQDHASKVTDAVVSRAHRLRDARKIKVVMTEILEELEDLRCEIGEDMERHRWRQQSSTTATPLTPESPSRAPLDSDSENLVSQRLDGIQIRLSKDVDSAVANLSATLELPLLNWLSQNLTGLKGFSSSVIHMAGVSSLVRQQADAMANIRDEVHTLQVQLEDARLRLDITISEALDGVYPGNDSSSVLAQVEFDVNELARKVEAFSSSLVHTVPLVSHTDSLSDTRRSVVKRRFSWGNLKLGAIQETAVNEFPFDLMSLDDAVRADCNSYVMRLSGELDSLHRKRNHLQLSFMAKELDNALSITLTDLRRVSDDLFSFKNAFTLSYALQDKVQPWRALLRDVDVYIENNRLSISRSFSPIRELLHRMKESSSLQDPAVESIITMRSVAIDDAALKLELWLEDGSALKDQISNALAVECARLEEQMAEARRKAEEERIQEEREKAEREENLEKDRLKLMELERDRHRKEMEELERQRLEQEATKRQEFEHQDLQLEHAGPVQVIDSSVVQSEKDGLEIERLHQPTETDASDAKLMQDQVDRQIDPQMNVLGPPINLRDSHRRRESDGHDSDVFGLRVAPAFIRVLSEENVALQSSIRSIRKRLRSIGIIDVARATSASTATLPTDELARRMEDDLSKISVEVTSLPLSASDASVDVELQSLRNDLKATSEQMETVRRLADLGQAVHSCDNALSDFLEHIDSYPDSPPGPLASSHVTDPSQSPEERLTSRVLFTKALLGQMTSLFAMVADDRRAIAERSRVLQTWSELEDMGNDRLSGRKSQPTSAVSSGRNSSASVISNLSSSNRKRDTYTNLSAGPSSRRQFLAPSLPPQRRTVSGSKEHPSRPTSRMSSTSSIRSVSGPMFSPSNRLYNSTFASRQRTSSLSSNSASVGTPVKGVHQTHARSSSQLRYNQRSSSPTFSETSSISRSAMTPSRTSVSQSSWARAPRQSFPSLPRISSPPKRPPLPKKTYVANPKNRLDVAVGDVVNKLPVNINVEVLPETWKDQSGKYWIGDQEPKLCFCRILRSQTVMVRVGGGWAELSKFIKDHFADVFRLIPESPPHQAGREEKWISSATLLGSNNDGRESNDLLSNPPKTPEPRSPHVPSFSLSTPSGQSPRSIHSTQSSGSPLTPLQFLRRADDSTGLRPASPLRSPLLRGRRSIPHTPSRTAVWRP